MATWAPDGALVPPSGSSPLRPPVADVADADPDPPHRPGFCSEHPGWVLLTHRRAGVRWYYAEDPATVCPHLDHDYISRERCRWCGGPLPQASGSGGSFRAAYCSGTHRSYGFRARARGLQP